jgi:hypothetical protein
MTLEKCRNRLIAIWGGSFLFLVLLLFVQTIFGKYGEKNSEVFGWLIPLTVPTLSLMLGVLVADKQAGTASQGVKADPTIYQIAKWLSVVYFSIIGLAFLVEPLVPYSPLDLMSMSKPFLGLFDGLITGVIAFFFVKK